MKGNNYVNSPSQVFNPENHSDMLVDTGDINNALKSHFSSIGQDRVDIENNIFQCEPSSIMCSLKTYVHVQFKNIREILLASVDYEAGFECLIVINS